MTINSVIIHPGHAHRDEFLALGIALVAKIITIDTPVYRRNPTVAELEDKHVLVLDVGRHHEPEYNNFDHHHLPRGTEECAMSLLAKHIMLDCSCSKMTFDELFEDQPWYKATIIADALGPFELAKHVGVDKIPIELKSPIEMSILELLESGFENSRVLPFVLEAAEHTISLRATMALKLKARHTQLEKEGRFITIKNINNDRGSFGALWFEGDDFGIQSFREKNNLRFVVSVFEAERSNGWGFYRFNDDPRIDFSKLKDDPRVSFAHAEGFYAETAEKVSEDTIYELLSRAMTS